MSDVSFGVQLSFASVDRGDGADPRDDARRILTEHRVPAAIRHAIAPWSEDLQEAVVLVPVTDDGHVLTLTDDDGLKTGLTAAALRAAFEAEGLTLCLSGDDDSDAADDVASDADADDSADDLTEGIELLEDLDEATTDDLSDEDMWTDGDLAIEPVRVASFSRRGAAIARVTAQLTGAPVEHIEHGTWSLMRYATTETGVGLPIAKAEGPVVELNRPSGGGDWVEVTVAGAPFAVPFWVDAEQDTTPIFHPDEITQPTTAEIIRRLLTEGDASRDELEDLARRCRLDVETAHRALVSESLGGIVGTDARLRAFLSAFGVPSELVEAALNETSPDAEAETFVPQGWGRTLGEVAVDGWASATPLTQRDRPLTRLSRALRKRPLLGMALTVGELTAGLALASRGRSVGRAFGVLLVIDAIADAVVWFVRLRRAR